MSRVLTTTRTLGDIVPLSLSDGGQLDATVVDATSTGGVTFSNDLVTSTSLVQWVAGISGQNGAGGVVPLRTGATIKQTQGGTILAPAVEIPLRFQVVDPTKGAYLFRLASTPNLGGTNDYLGFFGYNADGSVAGEPVCYFAIESSFEQPAGTFQLECYVHCEQTPGVHTARPFGFNLIRSTGAVDPAIQYVGGQFVLTGGPVGAPAQQWIVQDGSFEFTPSNYVLEGANGLTVQTAAGILSLSTAAANLTVTSAAQLLETSTSLLQLNAGTQLNLLAQTLLFAACDTIALAKSNTVQYGELRSDAAGRVRIAWTPGGSARDVITLGSNTDLALGANTQSLVGRNSFQAYLETALAATAVVDTHYAPASGANASVKVEFCGRDLTSQNSVSGTVQGACKNVAGTVSIDGTPVTFGQSGNAALTATVVTITAVANTINISVTPPGGFNHNIDWKFFVSIVED